MVFVLWTGEVFKDQQWFGNRLQRIPAVVAICHSICLYCVGIVLQCSIACPLLLLDYKLLGGMDVVFCLDHFTCCKATCTLSPSKYRGHVTPKLTIVGAVKIYMYEIVSFAVGLLWKGIEGIYYLKCQLRHI